MAWTFVPEAASEVQPSRPSDSAEPSATSSETPTASDSSSNVCETGGCHPLPSGTTSRPSTGDPGVDLWISSLVASRASRTALPASAPEGQTSAIFGPTSGGSFAKWDPWLCCLRTYQVCLALTEEPCSAAYSGTWPRAGMMRSGTAYRLQPLAPLTRGTGSGLWPTPRATDGAHGGPNQRGSKGDLTRPSAVHHWPTPSARDWRSGKASQMTLDRNSRPLNEVVTERDPQGGGSLNPTFVEWLMGWPIGWTACAPLAMVGYRKWRQSLLNASHGNWRWVE